MNGSLRFSFGSRPILAIRPRRLDEIGARTPTELAQRALAEVDLALASCEVRVTEPAGHRRLQLPPGWREEDLASLLDLRAEVIAVLAEYREQATAQLHSRRN